MAQLQLKSLLGKANAIIERGTNFFGKVLVDKEEMMNLIEEIVACIPADIKEAEMIIAGKEKTIQDAHNRAERIIQDAMNEQARLVSDNEVLRKVQDAVTKQKQQVDEYCENIQMNAARNAEEIKISAIRDAAQIKEGAESYAEQVFQDMASNISQILNKIVVCQNLLAQQRSQGMQQVPEQQYVEESVENSTEEQQQVQEEE